MPRVKKEKDPASVKPSSGRDFNLSVEDMAKAGLHFGHRSSTVHPKMAPYLYGVRNTVHIIDLEKTKEKLAEALEFLQRTIADKKTALLVGTKVQVRDIVRETAKECGLPYVVERWIGGTFTNFDVLKKRIDYFKDLERKKKEGALDKYTKKERAKFNQELKDLETKFAGIKNMESLPHAIFVLDMKKDALAVKEARVKKIKVVGVSDTNVDPTLADYPIPANDDAISSVKYILGRMKEAILAGQIKAKEE